MSAKRPTAEQLHEETLESKVQLRVATKHIREANEGLNQLLAHYEDASD